MELRDGELLLRPFGRLDTDAIAAACDDGVIARFIPLMPSPYTRADAEAWVERCADVWRKREAFPLAIVDDDSGELLGSIELNPTTRTVGYWVAAGARGRGIATRALRLVCSWTAERPLRLTTHPANLASQRVAEKAGFRRAGTIAGNVPFRDDSTELVLFELD